MGPLSQITLTGAGESTPILQMAELSSRYRLIEFGILYDPALAGKPEHPRYPSLAWIHKFAKLSEELDIPASLHLCGDAIHAALFDPVPDFETISSVTESGIDLVALDDAISRIGRVQLNIGNENDSRVLGRNPGYLSTAVMKLGRRGPDARTKVSVQLNDFSKKLCESLNTAYCGFSVDASCGRGVVPASQAGKNPWPDRVSLGLHGSRICYAGGLGPDTIEVQLPLIFQATQGARNRGSHVYSIDMESSLRGRGDTFDLGKCELVVMKVMAMGLRQEAEEASAFGSGDVSVTELDGIWLDWWVGASQGYDMNLPPEDASAATYMHHGTEKHESFRPRENLADALRLFQSERIGCEPDADGNWTSWALPREFMEVVISSDSMVTAGLRAIVAKTYGATVPMNPVGMAARYGGAASEGQIADFEKGLRDRELVIARADDNTPAFSGRRHRP